MLADLRLKHGEKRPPEGKDGHGASQGHEHGEDPHVWLSPMLVRGMLPHITKALVAAMPEKAEMFRANAQALSDELEALDAELAAVFREIPRNNRVFLTFHPAWRYFAHNYELTELAIESEGKEPGPKTMKMIIDEARRYGLTVIFVEPQFPKAAAEAVAANINASVAVLNPLAEDLPANLRETAKALASSFPRSAGGQ